MNAKRLLRSIMPDGLLNVVHRKHVLDQIQSTGKNHWAGALSNHTREMLEKSKLEDFPSHLFTDVHAVVDIGAHLGLWSESVLELIKPEVLVAIEPSPDTFKQLSQRLSRYPNAKLLPYAVGAKKGKTEFNIFNLTDFNSMLAPQESLYKTYDQLKIVDTINVEVCPLDELLKDVGEISILKLDVQGKESEVLTSSPEVVRRTRLILVEVSFVSHYQGDTVFSDLHRLMLDLNFGLYSFPFLYRGPVGNLTWGDAIYMNLGLA